MPFRPRRIGEIPGGPPNVTYPVADAAAGATPLPAGRILIDATCSDRAVAARIAGRVVLAVEDDTASVDAADGAGDFRAGLGR